METKICTKCNTSKTITEFRSQKIKERIYFRGYCKKCGYEIKQLWSKNNKEKVAAMQKRYQEKNKNKCITRHKEYYEKNKQTINEKAAIYAKNNENQVLETQRRWAKNHHDLKLKNGEQMRIKMTDGYIVDCLVRTSNIPRKEFYNNPELIQLHRNLITLKRKLKNEKD